jgi:hypothetical protein
MVIRTLTHLWKPFSNVQLNRNIEGECEASNCSNPNADLLCMFVTDLQSTHCLDYQRR